MVSLLQKTTLPFIAIEVEAMVARRALELALETGFDRVILEGDSQILVTALENSSRSLSHFGHIVKMIYSTLPLVSQKYIILMFVGIVTL